MKKIISFSVILLIISISFIAFANESIIYSDWAKEDVNTAIEKGYVSSISTTDYTKNITREDFCNLAFNILNDNGFDLKQTKDNPFLDVSNPNINALNSSGIINGKSETEFAPNDYLTREEAAAILHRTYAYACVDDTYSFILSSYIYLDQVDISDWAKEDIYAMKQLDIMNGTGNDKFSPKENYSIEQSIATLLRLSAKINTNKKEITFADALNENMPQNSNYMFSPFSIKTAMAMAANGATGDTRKEILDALKINNLDEFNTFSKNLINKFAKNDILNIDIENSIWINKSNTDSMFSNDYKNIILNYYNGEAREVSNDDAVNIINGWVNEKTNGKIKDIISDSNFASALINAIYFKANWVKVFDDNNTYKETFTDKNGIETDIDFMHSTSYFDYSNENQVEIVKLPYSNYLDTFDDLGNYVDSLIDSELDVSMFLMMSDNKFNAEEILAKSELNRSNLDFAMPKFKIEYSSSLGDILKNLGVNLALDENTADFTKMFDNGNMFIDNVIHKTYIDVNEKGTEATAVTGVMMGATAFDPSVPQKVYFDKPFTFVIRDNTSGEILFMGEYNIAK